jgi:hypothetical protein
VKFSKCGGRLAVVRTWGLVPSTGLLPRFHLPIIFRSPLKVVKTAAERSLPGETGESAVKRQCPSPCMLGGRVGPVTEHGNGVGSWLDGRDGGHRRLEALVSAVLRTGKEPERGVTSAAASSRRHFRISVLE